MSPDEIESLKAEVRKRMTMKKYGSYYINGYAMLFAIETGVRVGELCALKWEDITANSIHIHSQQLNKRQGHCTDRGAGNPWEPLKRHQFSKKRKPGTLELSSILDSQTTAEDGT